MKYLSQKQYSLVNKQGEKTTKAKIENNKLPHFKSIRKIYIPDTINDSLELKDAKNILAKECTVISTGNHKGGVLKTTNCCNLAASMAFYGYKVLLVDCDPQSNATKGFGLFQNNYNLIDNNSIQLMLDIENDMDDIEFKSKINESIINVQRASITGRLDILPNDPKMIKQLRRLDDLTNSENALDYILSFVKEDYDFILIDTPPRTDTILKICLMASDYFLISLRPEPFATLGIPDIFDPVKEIRRAYKMRKNKDLFVLGGIVGDVGSSNLHKANIEQNKEDIEFLTNKTASLFETQISHFEKVGESQIGDGAMIFTDFQHDATKEYLTLTNEIITKILEIEVINSTDNEN